MDEHMQKHVKKQGIDSLLIFIADIKIGAINLNPKFVFKWPHNLEKSV